MGSAGYSSRLRFPSPFPYPQEVRRGACTAWQGGLLGPRWGRDEALLTLPSAGKQGPRLWARTECGPLLRAAPSGEVFACTDGSRLTSRRSGAQAQAQRPSGLCGARAPEARPNASSPSARPSPPSAARIGRAAAGPLGKAASHWSRPRVCPRRVRPPAT